MYYPVSLFDIQEKSFDKIVDDKLNVIHGVFLGVYSFKICKIVFFLGIF